MTRDYFLSSLRLEFRLLDANVDGQIGDADREIHRSMAEAAARLSAISDLLVADINADGLITEDELRQFLLYRLQQSDPQPNQYAGRRKQIEINIQQFMSADADHDGRLSVHEISNP